MLLLRRHLLWAVAAAALASVGALHAQPREGQRQAVQPREDGTRERPFGEPIRFRHLGLADGLPNPVVRALHQDPLGFLWIGTNDGLARYDGDEMRTYRPVPFDTTSLRGTWTIALAGAANGDVWVLNESGPLNRYDRLRDTFSAAPGDTLVLDGRELLARQDGTVWIGGRYSGLYHHDPDRETTVRIATDRLGTSVSALVEDAQRRLWIGTHDGGLGRLAPDGTLATFRHDPADPSSLPSDFVGALLLGADGRLWIGTDRGLAVTDGKGRFESAGGLGETEVLSLLEDPSGDLWIGTSDGLIRLDSATGRTARYAHDPADPTSISHSKVHALFLDRAGTFWVGTETGLSAFVWAAPPFDHLDSGQSDPVVWAIVEARDGTLWVGTRSGLSGIAPDGSIRRLRSDGTAATIGPGWVVSLFEEPGGSLLVGTRRHLGRSGVLTRLDPTTGRVLRQFRRGQGGPLTDHPWAIQTDRRGRVWVLSGGNGCPSRLDAATDTFEAYCPGRDPSRRLDAKAFAEDDAGQMWFGAWGDGLVRLDLATGETRQLSHDPADPNTPPGNVVESFAEGPGGSLWLGTYGAGLSLFDPSSGAFRHFHTGNSGLPSNVVYAAEPDDDGYLWLSTNAGLVRFDPEMETFETFGLEDGLQDLEFNGGVSHRGPDGALYFGGVNGLNRFYPDRIGAEARARAATVTGVAVQGRAAEIGGALDAAAPYAETVRLGPRERDVAFTVAAPGAPGRVRYRVRLDGYDAGWHPPGPARTAAYTNLDPGRYTFRVQASSGTAWDGPEHALAVVVAPRWFQATGVRLLAALALVGGLGLVVQARARRTREREAALEAKVLERTEALRERSAALEAEKRTTEAQAERLREVGRLRTRFFTNVSHEFRTPLTLTIGPLEDLQTGDALPETAQRSVDLALRSSRRLLRLTNQLLDAARLDAGEMALRARPLDLAQHVRAAALSFAPLAERRRLAFDVETPPVPVEVWADADKLDAIVVNLLSNAFKFTPEGGTVQVAVRADGDTARVEVRDDGPGIAAEDLPHVFDRFYRTTEAGGTEGTGIGLSLARDLAALHGGTLQAASAPGEGSAFTLALPMGRAHLGDHQVVPAPPDDDPPTTLAPDLSGVVERDDEDADADDRTTVLIADDNADIRAYVRSHLAPRYRVLEAEDGQQALATARRETPDLIVSDVMMPVLGGVGLVQALRADAATDFIPVVLLTAKAEEADVQHGLDAGADDYVVKPFNVQTLQARIENLIASRRWLRARFAAPPSGSAGTAADDGLPAAPGAPPPADGGTAFLHAAHAAIDARLGDEALTVEALADDLGTTRSTLHRRLKADADVTPTALIRQVRLARGRELLRAGEGTVSEVAYAVGFKSVSHFSRTYSQRYSLPPSAEARETGEEAGLG